MVIKIPTPYGNGSVYYSGNDLSYDDKTWRAQYLDADNSVSAKKIFRRVPRCARFSCRRSHIHTVIGCGLVNLDINGSSNNEK